MSAREDPALDALTYIVAMLAVGFFTVRHCMDARLTAALQKQVAALEVGRLEGETELAECRALHGEIIIPRPSEALRERMRKKGERL